MQLKTIPQNQLLNFRLVPVGHTSYAIVDPCDFERVSRYRWRLRKSNHCFYAVHRFFVNGKAREQSMHRFIMQTPPDLECHHVNHKTLDNRRCNLRNLDSHTHALEHGKSF